MSEKLRLSLTAPALQQLIGGNSEIELEIRQCVASAFAHRNLRELLNDETRKIVNDLANTLSSEQQKIVREETKNIVAKYDNSGWRGPRASLSNEVVELIKRRVQEDVSGLLRAEVTKAIEEQVSLVEKIVRNEVAGQTDSAVKQAVRDRLRQILASA